MPRTLVVYHYFEADDIHRKNLDYFLKHGYNDEDDFVLVIAGGCTLDLPVAPNIKYLHIANTGFDFSGFSRAIRTDAVLDKYHYFVFLNSTVRGPFIPHYCSTPWTVLFTNILSDDVKLVGATINILDVDTDISKSFRELYSFREPFAHVQSMIFCTDRVALEFLIKSDFFDREIGPDKFSVVLHFEILLSQLLIQNGWNISSLLPEYSKIDYRNVSSDINPTSKQGDPCWPGGYFSRSLSPYETIFIKANRNIVDLQLLDQMGLSQSCNPYDGRSAYQSSRFDSIVNSVNSAWKGHKNFAMWLTNRLQPSVTVDLGVDFGFSTYCFAAPRTGHVFGIDAFEGDEHAGFRDTEDFVRTILQRLELKNVTIIKGYFDTVAKHWTKEIDILHIDGRHKYEDVREEFRTWTHFLKPDGVVLLHDTCVKHYGVRQFFDEIDSPKVNLWNSYGLGVISKNAALIGDVTAVFEKFVEPGTAQL